MPNTVIPIISKQAGTKHIKTALLPMVFNFFKSNDKPLLVKMITSAIWRIYEETEYKVSSISPKTDDDIKTPNIKYQIILGI